MTLFCVALLYRGAAAFFGFDHLQADPDAYRAIADTLAESGVYGLTAPSGEVLPTAFRPPLYPCLISFFVSDDGVSNLSVAIFHALLGSLTALFTFLTCRAWLGSKRGRLPGILAAGLVIVDPILVQQSTLVMTETVATALASLVIYWWASRVSVRLNFVSVGGLGLLLALAYFCRPTFVVWTALLVVGMALATKPSGAPLALRLRSAGIVSLIVFASMALWTGRNLAVLGHPIWATTHGGYTLLLGNNPLIYRHLRDQGPFELWDSSSFLNAYLHRYEGKSSSENFWLQKWDQPVMAQPELSARLTEHDDDRVAYQAAKSTIQREPGMFAYSCFVRVYRLWTPFPYLVEGRSAWKVFGIGIYYCLLYTAAFVGLLKLRKVWWSSVWWPIPALILTLTMVHAVYWSNMRMRTPAIPAIAILASLACLRGDVLPTEAGKED